MWLPRGVEQFFETALARLAEIKEALKDQERTTRYASQAANEKRGEIPRIIAAAIRGSHEDVPAYEKTQRDKEYAQHGKMLNAAWATAVFTALAFGAAGIYACIANQQLGKMDATYGEMRNQTKAALWSSYYSCLSAQSAQKTISQIEDSARDTHAAAAATIQQAAAGIESERAYVNFLPKATIHGQFAVGQVSPAPTNQSTDILIATYSIKNSGKSKASFNVWYDATLVEDTDKLILKKDTSAAGASGIIKVGEDVPDPGGDQAHPFTLFIPVRKANRVPVAWDSPEAKGYFQGPGLVVVFGEIQYADFWGAYKDKFCVPFYERSGTNPPTTAPEREHVNTCISYNHEEDHFRYKPGIGPLKAGPQEPPPIVCAAPKD